MALPSRLHANFTATPGGFGTYSFSWDAVTDPAAPGNAVNYKIYRIFGNKTPLDGNDPPAIAGVTRLGQTTKTTLQVFGVPNGTECFGVQAIDAVTNVLIAGSGVVTCHAFVHITGLSDIGGMKRADANGTQLGFGQQWNFTYFLDVDTLMTFKIFPQNAAFVAAADGDGLTQQPTSSPTKIVTSTTPRSGELDGTVSDLEQWDCRDSSGAVVGNGIYYAYYELTDPNPSDTASNAGIAKLKRDTGLLSIPVDILRIMNVKTTGITSTNLTGTIQYDLTGDATVRIVVAQPGTRFMQDDGSCPGSTSLTLGDVYPRNGATNLCDPTLIVSTITFNKKAAVGITTNWCGTTGDGCTGTQISTPGIYAVGISAKDGFGNRALDANGNDGPISNTITYDPRSTTNTGQSHPALIVMSATVNNVPISTFTIQLLPQLQSFSTITVTMSNPLTSGQISVTHAGAPVAGVGTKLTNNGLTIEFDAQAPNTAPGQYTFAVSAQDTFLQNNAPASISFQIQGTAANPAPPTQSADQFKNSVISFPNPARSGKPASIAFNVLGPSSVDIDIFTVLGARLFHVTKTYAGGGTQVFPWNLVNDQGANVGSGVYLVRVTAHVVQPDGTNATFSTTRKVMVIR